ncbi:hypothetical protein GYMLUDRAFT_96074 [Collybiopsis luxurians FD-317 M1]|uniref:AAA+ ATPase domain-containing protein n=1 Tax=Collybiopsis luxurians FD-317 M1 TaxID=944289 RepID=A0A0D0CIG3_9AGAR|nr:hypothetical protein GYMLUDRAFT_96074 [Collybiopsis luxurians FD-317 M1]
MPSTTLGKRSRETDSASDQLRTPEATPNQKRPKVTPTVLDGDSNKENIPPLKFTPVNGTHASPPMSARAARALRRSTTSESIVTPPRARVLKRTASFSTSFSNLVIATPPPTPLNLLPFHARVRALFRSNCNSTVSLPSRENEREIITTFLESFINQSDSDSFQSLYISGSPGCGKTALIHSILASLTDQLDKTKIVNLNCMALNNLDALWDRLVDEFDGLLLKKRKAGTGKGKGREMVESMLSETTGRCILVLDEMDHIASNPQSISSLLNLAKSDRLCVIGIANTHTLTSSPASSLIDIRTLHFSPYTSAQLLQILQSRLALLTPSAPGGSQTAPDATMKKLLPLSTLILLTKKIATLTGDVRTLFEVLRAAIDLAVASASASSTATVDDDSFFAEAGSIGSVTTGHILEALKTIVSSKSNQTSASASTSSPSSALPSTTSNSAIISKTAALGLQARLVLLAVLIAAKRVEAGLSVDASSSRNSSPSNNNNSNGLKNPFESSSSATVVGAHLYAFYSHILRRGGDVSISTPASRNEFADLLGMLEGTGLIVLSSSSLSLTSPRKKRVCFGRSSSFKSGSSSSSFSAPGFGLSEEIRLAPGVWADEVLRGLGVRIGGDAQSQVKDVRGEELNALWIRENAAIRKELKTLETKRNKQDTSRVFADAFSDD